MSATYVPPEEADLMAVIAAVKAELQDLEAVLRNFPDIPVSPDRSLGKRRGLDATTYLPVYDAAQALCDQARFQEALPLAFYLMVHEPQHQPFNFLLASCLHRLGRIEEAAQLYALSVNDGPDDAIALFRLGECLQAANHLKQAAEAYEASLEVARDNPDLWQLQEWAMTQSRTISTCQESHHGR